MANTHNIDYQAIVVLTDGGLFGDDIFSMKTFTGRVKEDTVQFVINWSIIF